VTMAAKLTVHPDLSIKKSGTPDVTMRASQPQDCAHVWVLYM